MNKAPKIGQRVRYREKMEWGQPREVTGVVTKIYVTHDDVFDADDEFVRAGPASAEREWHAAIKVDSRPAWWPYPDSDQFAPQVKNLTKVVA